MPTPIRLKRLRTGSKKTVQNPTPTDRTPPTRPLPKFITQEAMNAIKMPTKTTTTLLEHFCVPVIHLITGEFITDYEKLEKTPATREVWTTEFGKEQGNLEQGYRKTGTKGANSLFVLYHREIKWTLANCTVTYANIVVDYFPKREDPNRVRIIVGGNLINLPG